MVPEAAASGAASLAFENPSETRGRGAPAASRARDTRAIGVAPEPDGRENGTDKEDR